MTVKRPVRDGQGILATRDATVYRNRWVMEKKEFFEERARTAQAVRDVVIKAQEAVRQRPELAPLRDAVLAARSLRDPESQAQFVSRIRHALADGIQSGEPLITVRVRERREAKSPPHRLLDGREGTREL